MIPTLFSNRFFLYIVLAFFVAWMLEGKARAEGRRPRMWK